MSENKIFESFLNFNGGRINVNLERVERLKQSSREVYDDVLSYLVEKGVLSLERNGNYNVNIAPTNVNPRIRGEDIVYFTREEDGIAYKKAVWGKGGGVVLIKEEVVS